MALLKVLTTPLRRLIAWAGRLRRRKRVPVVLQMSTVECGVACLTMILRYFGHDLTLSDCRRHLTVGRDGSSARQIAQLGRFFGLWVKSYACEPEHLAYLQLPAIAHWKFNHFVVVERYTPTKIVIVDPASGRRTITQEEFNKCFTGVILTFGQGAEFSPSRYKGQHPWRTYLSFALQAPKLFSVLGQVLIASLILQGLGLALPLFTKIVIDDVLPHRMDDVLTLLGLGLLVFVVTHTVTGFLRTALLIYLRAKVDTHLMLGFFEHLLSLPFRFFQTRKVGDLLMRLSSNAVVREVFTNQTVSAILDGVLVVVYVSILLYVAPLFGAVVLGLGLLQVVLVIATTRYMHQLTEQDLATQAESQGYLVEVLKGIPVLKASGAETQAFNRWTDLFFTNLNASLKRSQAGAVFQAATAFFHGLSPFALLWLGAFLVLDGSLTLGTMLALTSLAGSFLGPLSSLVANGQRLQLVGAHLERITDVIEAEPEQARGAGRILHDFSGRLELKNVSFRYDEGSPYVVEDISVTVEPGQKIAMVGRTGSGKSTLALLMLGLYTPTEGQILVDGHPLDTLNLRALRSHFGVVLQEPTLFSGSLMQNIALNDPHMPSQRIVASAELASIDREIIQMPLGYSTLISEGGGGLSGGQKQRISLARALAGEPKVLVLDEATSHLDVVTEAEVDQHLGLIKCTRIVIAHRLSTIRNADLILVLDNGRIIERGTHDELVERDGHYALLIKDQVIKPTEVMKAIEASNKQAAGSLSLVRAAGMH